MTTDPYAALGLKKTASAEDIKKAYKKIVRVSHPDLNPDDAAAEAKFKAAAAAYDLLKDPAQRARFDAGEIDASGAERQPERKFYRDYAGQQPDGSQGFGGQGFGGSGFGGQHGDPADIFADFLRHRGGGGGAKGFASQGSDLRFSMDVPFLDAARGAKMPITLPDGAKLEVQIPPGASDGQTLRLRGKGAAGIGGAPAGDALITITVRAHPTFRREGNDILTILPIGIDEAVLGAKVEAPTIDGPVNLTIPKGASSGRVLRLRGRGVQPHGAKERGDQRIELRIVLPAKIDPELEAFMEVWRKTHAHDPRKGGRT